MFIKNLYIYTTDCLVFSNNDDIESKYKWSHFYHNFVRDILVISIYLLCRRKGVLKYPKNYGFYGDLAILLFKIDFVKDASVWNCKVKIIFKYDLLEPKEKNVGKKSAKYFFQITLFAKSK